MGRRAGSGMGRGFGPGLGWFAVGYGSDDPSLRGEGLRGALEQRAAFLRAELARTESLLQNESLEGGPTPTGGEAR